MNIAIIGGGITGLTTALALHKLGLNHVTVYEQADELNEIGAGIWLQPNALRVMDWLGLKERLMEVGVSLDKMEVTNASLQPIKEIQEEIVEDEYGNRTLAIHRGKLQRVLYDAVADACQVKLGMEYEKHEVGNELTIKFTKGEIKSDVLFGADGIQSSVRQSIFEDTKLRDTNQICWRGIANYDLPHQFKHKGREAWGRNKRFGFSEVGEEQVYWFAVMNYRKELKGLSKEKLIEYYIEFNPIVADMINNTSFIHEANLTDLKRIPKWSIGNVCLLGDEAHATTPNMGQGACQGIEDAYYIAQCLSKTKAPNIAFENFENSRRKKVDYVVNNSWRFGKLAHNTLGQEILKLIMKATPDKVLSKQMMKLYNIEMTQQN